MDTPTLSFRASTWDIIAINAVSMWGIIAINGFNVGHHRQLFCTLEPG
jgi:hypothetical protein